MLTSGTASIAPTTSGRALGQTRIVSEKRAITRFGLGQHSKSITETIELLFLGREAYIIGL